MRATLRFGRYFGSGLPSHDMQVLVNQNYVLVQCEFSNSFCSDLLAPLHSKTAKNNLRYFCCWWQEKLRRLWGVKQDEGRWNQRLPQFFRCAAPSYVEACLGMRSNSLLFACTALNHLFVNDESRSLPSFTTRSAYPSPRAFCIRFLDCF